MLYFTNKKSDCSGCSACYSICPVHCISMHKDEEGFLYPVSSDKCINCGKCKSICPIQNINIPQSKFRQRAFCAVTRNKKIWKRSASGGAFSEICKAFADENTLICGAAWDGFTVKHVCVRGIDNISLLCKSKYIASEINDVFIEIERNLQTNNKVVFCGTPCQVSGLKSMLKIDYSNLLLIDLICHGVGSASVFNECICELENQFKCIINSYEFRSKRNCYQTDHLTKITLNDGSEKFLTNDRYIQLFLNQNCLRPSCGENCRFRTEHRQGDITIADFKGLTEIFPELSGTNRNYSTIIINSEKGDNLLNILRKNMIVFECELDDIKKFNPLFYRQTWFSKDRDTFFDDFINNSSEAIRKWTKPSNINVRSFKRKVFDLLPVYIRHLILKKRKRMQLL